MFYHPNVYKFVYTWVSSVMARMGKKRADKVQFRLDSETMEFLENFATKAGMTVNGFAKQAMLEQLATLDSEQSQQQDTQRILTELAQEVIGLSRRQSLSTDVILHMLAVSEIGDMTDKQVEAWVARNLPRDDHREGGLH